MQNSSTTYKAWPWRVFVLLSVLFLAASRFDLFYSVSGPPVITGLAGGRADDALKSAGLLGLFLWSLHSLWKHRNFSLQVSWVRTSLLAAYCAWCTLTLFWSDETHLTTGRLVILALAILVALALALRFSLYEIAALAFVYSASSNLVGLCAEVALGSFRPWEGGYRFSGLWHPNTHGMTLALLVLAGLAIWRSETGKRRWIAAVTGFGFILLLLTRSRTSFGGVVIVAVLSSLLLARPAQRWAAIIAVGLAGSFATFVSRNELLQLPVDSVLMGREDGDASTLTNRIPLWKDCLPYIERQYWTGYGYGGFWTPERIVTITAPEETAWRPQLIQYVQEGSFLPDAHNLYIETALETGIIGLLLLGGGLLLSVLVLGFQTFRTGSPVYGFAFSVLIWLCIEACLEAITPQPCLPFLIGPLLLAKTAFVGDRRRNLVTFASPAANEFFPQLEVTHA